MKIAIDDLILEVTRRCNMRCPHCLRGEAESLDADIDLIPQIFEGVSEIGMLTFSGGEPSLNTAYITAVVDYILEHDITVNGCFIATNAKVYAPELVDCVRRLYEANLGGHRTEVLAEHWLRLSRDEDEVPYFSIAVSGDPYHEPVPVENLMRYRHCGFFSDIKVNDGKYILDRGRGSMLANAFDRPILSLSIEADDDGENLLVSQVYVSSNGVVAADCDLSFDDLDMLEPGDDGYVGNIGDDLSLAGLLVGKLATV